MLKNSERVVAVLGASSNPERYSYKAIKRLLEAGFTVKPVSPLLTEFEGIPVYPDLASAGRPLDSVTVYLSAKRSSPLADSIIAAHPDRVILNPGAENPELEEKLAKAGIPYLHACTLVLLATKRF